MENLEEMRKNAGLYAKGIENLERNINEMQNKIDVISEEIKNGDLTNISKMNNMASIIKMNKKQIEQHKEYIKKYNEEVIRVQKEKEEAEKQKQKEEAEKEMKKEETKKGYKKLIVKKEEIESQIEAMDNLIYFETDNEIKNKMQEDKAKLIEGISETNKKMDNIEKQYPNIPSEIEKEETKQKDEDKIVKGDKEESETLKNNEDKNDEQEMDVEDEENEQDFINSVIELKEEDIKQINEESRVEKIKEGIINFFKAIKSIATSIKNRITGRKALISNEQEKNEFEESLKVSQDELLHNNVQNGINVEKENDQEMDR